MTGCEGLTISDHSETSISYLGEGGTLWLSFHGFFEPYSSDRAKEGDKQIEHVDINVGCQGILEDNFNCGPDYNDWVSNHTSKISDVDNSQDEGAQSVTLLWDTSEFFSNFKLFSPEETVPKPDGIFCDSCHDWVNISKNNLELALEQWYRHCVECLEESRTRRPALPPPGPKGAHSTDSPSKFLEIDFGQLSKTGKKSCVGYEVEVSVDEERKLDTAPPLEQPKLDSSRIASPAASLQDNNSCKLLQTSAESLNAPSKESRQRTLSMMRGKHITVHGGTFINVAGNYNEQHTTVVLTDSSCSRDMLALAEGAFSRLDEAVSLLETRIGQARPVEKAPDKRRKRSFRRRCTDSSRKTKTCPAVGGKKPSMGTEECLRSTPLNFGPPEAPNVQEGFGVYQRSRLSSRNVWAFDPVLLTVQQQYPSSVDVTASNLPWYNIHYQPYWYPTPFSYFNGYVSLKWQESQIHARPILT